MVSIILPTYDEAENIGRIVPLLFDVLREKKLKGEVIVVDDNSPDGTARLARRLAEQYPVRVHVREKRRGLSSAVIEGFGLARGDVCVVMDADLSHPPDKVPEMIEPIVSGLCDATVGTRYADGGGCKDWPLMRRLISKCAGVLARGVTRLSDPTSGFMAIRKDQVIGRLLDPIGWKIVLEVIVKTNCSFIEIPIVFRDRRTGASKLNFKVQRDYLTHLWRLYRYKYLGSFRWA